MRTLLVIATALLGIHTLEEVVWYFQASQPVGLPPAGVFALAQVVLYGFVAFAFWKPSKFLYGMVGAVLLYEVVHLLSAFRAEAYTPGLVTAIAIFVFAFPYWISLYRSKLNLL